MTGESGQNQVHMMTVALSYTATYCNTLQRTAVALPGLLESHDDCDTETHCNTLQHAVKHCNAL